MLWFLCVTADCDPSVSQISDIILIPDLRFWKYWNGMSEMIGFAMC